MPELRGEAWHRYAKARGWDNRVAASMTGLNAMKVRHAAAGKNSQGATTLIPVDAADRFCDLVGEHDAKLLFDTSRYPWIPPSEYDARYPHLARWRQGLDGIPEPAPWGPVYGGLGIGPMSADVVSYRIDVKVITRELRTARMIGRESWMQDGTERANRYLQPVVALANSKGLAPQAWVQTWCFLLGYERVLALIDPESLADHVSMMKRGGKPRTVLYEDLWPPYNKGLPSRIKWLDGEESSA